MQVLSKITIFVGVLFVLYGCVLLWERNNPKRLSFNNYSSKINYSPRFYPLSLEIPSASIKAQIIPSKLTDQKWETVKNGISYLTSSPVPGTRGNSVLYGHNWPDILGNLENVKTGQRIVIRNNAGIKKEFIVTSIAIVTPDQTHVLSPSNDVRITLYTCAGFLDSKRLVVTAVSSEYDPQTQLTERRNDL